MFLEYTVYIFQCIQFLNYIYPREYFPRYLIDLLSSCDLHVSRNRQIIKDTVMQTEKALTNNRLRDSKVPWKFRIPTMYNFAVIYPWNLQFS